MALGFCRMAFADKKKSLRIASVGLVNYLNLYSAIVTISVFSNFFITNRSLSPVIKKSALLSLANANKKLSLLLCKHLQLILQYKTQHIH